MTRKEELEARARDYVSLFVMSGAEPAATKNLAWMLKKVEREVWEKVIASVNTQIDIYDSQVEGCDADEFALYNSMIAELSKFIRWLTAQQQEQP